MAKTPSVAGKAAKIILWTGAALGAAALSNALLFNKTPPLQSALAGGETRYYQTLFGDVFYKKAGNGPPLLLVHGVGAGCSSFEFRHIWSELSRHYTVYALDLLGFGKSDKPNIAYSAGLYVDLLADFARDVMGVGGENASKINVLASSLGAAFVTVLAAREPNWFDRLVLVCPTGIQTLAHPPAPTAQAVRAGLRTPILGATLYNMVTSHMGIGYYLSRRVYARPETATWDIVKHYHQAAHQPGGPNAIAHFVTGLLNVNVRDAFTQLSSPILLVWGDALSTETPLGEAEAFLQANPTARLETIADSGMLPHEEQAQRFHQAVLPFLQGDSY